MFKMIYPKVVFTILCLASFCVRGENSNTNSRTKQFQQSISDSTGLNEDKRTGVLDRPKASQVSLMTFIRKLLQMVVNILCLTPLCGRFDNSEKINKKIEQFRQSIVHNTGLNEEKKAAVLHQLKGFQDSLGNRGKKIDLGSKAGAEHYKAEVRLLAAYFDAGLPMNSGFGKWLKRDLDLQVDVSQYYLKKQTELTDKQRKNRKMVLDQLAYDLSNLGKSMTTEKMMEHTNWLDDDYEGFERRRGRHG